MSEVVVMQNAWVQLTPGRWVWQMNDTYIGVRYAVEGDCFWALTPLPAGFREIRRSGDPDSWEE